MLLGTITVKPQTYTPARKFAYGNDMAAQASWLDVLGYPARIRVLQGLLGFDEPAAAELAEAVNLSEPALRVHLQALVALGIVVERQGAHDGVTPGRPASRFQLQPELRSRAMELIEVLAEPLGTSPPSAPRRSPHQ